MTVGIVMLAHTALDRAAQVARHWLENGKPVVIHLDKSVSAADTARFQEKLAEFSDVRFSERFSVEWGNWSLVAATLEASTLMLEAFPQVTSVYLSSGSCLPLRPIQELQEYLDAYPGTDFIESVTPDDVTWIVGGLDHERFTLRFPFSWRRHRKLFDRYVRLQRRLNFQRKIPEGIVPHLGSQWWCLSRSTLSAILNDPERSVFDRYFRRVWIPDESYFQTMVRRHSDKIESRSLTLAKFDFHGKPHIFYDDHIQLLKRSNCFIARKIWPHADQLYQEFLTLNGPRKEIVEPDPSTIDRLFNRATERRISGRPGLYMQGRFPNPDAEVEKTAQPYSIFHGFNDVFNGFEDWLSKQTNFQVHGHLFAKDKAHFAGGETIFRGALSEDAALRDYNPTAFLTNLIWNTRGTRQCFQFGPSDNQKIVDFVASDKNAQISVITGAWTLPLFQSGRSIEELKHDAEDLQRVEAAYITLLRSGDVKANIHIWTLADFLYDPMRNLQPILEEIGGAGQRRLKEVPKMVDLTDFGHFLQSLKNEGIGLNLMGDFPISKDADASHPVRGAKTGK